jgi:hypothetical protein
VFTLLVSWLLVVFVPGLLMLVTFGLQRLESGLNSHTVTASDLSKPLARAGPDATVRLDGGGTPGASDAPRDRRANGVERYANSHPASARVEPELPTQVNPQVQPTRYANRV